MICVRCVQVGDIPRLVEIAARSPTAALWTERQYLQLCTPANAAGRLSLVVCHDEQVEGFLAANSVTPHRDEWEIENLVVSGPMRRRGLASRLLEEFLARARERGGRRVFLEVRGSNEAARRLYEKWAFVEVGRRRSYYQNPTEDALIFGFTFPQPG